MSRRCELTGKAVQSGNKVSHSNRKTRTRFLPNLCHVTLISDALGRSVRLRVAAAALRSAPAMSGRRPRGFLTSGVSVRRASTFAAGAAGFGPVRLEPAV